MKNFRFFLSAALATVCFAATAQDLSDPKYAVWGETEEQRHENILANQYLKQNLDSKNYEAASGYLKKLLDNAPKGSASIYQRGALLFKRKYALAKDPETKKQCIDSLMVIYDLRVEHFGNAKTQGKAYILDIKAKDYLNYRSEDREGLRAAFEAAIDAAIEQDQVDHETITIYFGNLCEDYKNGDGNVGAEDVILVYDRLSPCFEVEGAADHKTVFDNHFGASGVASCENLEEIFRKKLAANPDSADVLAQAVSLMSRAKCTGSFYLTTAEQYYKVKPSAETALFLAQAFQNEQNFDKAIQYLNEAIAVETDPAEKEKLYVRVAVVDLAARNYSGAAAAARAAQELNPENGYSYFVLAQCYAASASACQGLDGEAVYWAAYDTMAKAVARLESEPETLEHAKSMLQMFRNRFPTSETCFFAELKEGERYTVKCGSASGVATTVRFR
ncbi:MAG: enzyme of heme biosynthesis [Alistipes sp.]|nr:enzyme of heme biosynthesis [Alistipes sp.]